MITRRRLLKAASAGAALTGSGVSFLQMRAGEAAGLDLPAELPEGARAEAIHDDLPAKRPLIKLTYRPPNYETPIEYFRSAITPNDAFYVRYHLSDIPQVDAKTWKLSIGGEGANAQAELTFDDLQKMPAVEIAAVNQCSGNRRGLFKPHVVGVQWGYGGMGCARWKGARLRDILDKVGVKKEAIEIVLDGADGPVVDKTPDFVKSIPVWKAMEDTTIVAYEMNGEPLPHFNGFPARVIVPGWTGTYWMKHVTSINAVTKPFTGFWMGQGPRATDRRCSSRSPGPPMLFQASYRSKTNDVNGLPVGFPKEGGVPPGTGSLMPMKNPASKFGSTLGPPAAPAALRRPALLSRFWTVKRPDSNATICCC
jgi:DMSO/TMAO reductase YedYZ molybdopterin-dependent catalytic subunit